MHTHNAQGNICTRRYCCVRFKWVSWTDESKRNIHIKNKENQVHSPKNTFIFLQKNTPNCIQLSYMYALVSVTRFLFYFIILQYKAKCGEAGNTMSELKALYFLGLSLDSWAHIIYSTSSNQPSETHGNLVSRKKRSPTSAAPPTCFPYAPRIHTLKTQYCCVYSRMQNFLFGWARLIHEMNALVSRTVKEYATESGCLFTLIFLLSAVVYYVCMHLYTHFLFSLYDHTTVPRDEIKERISFTRTKKYCRRSRELVQVAFYYCSPFPWHIRFYHRATSQHTLTHQQTREK